MYVLAISPDYDTDNTFVSVMEYIRDSGIAVDLTRVYTQDSFYDPRYDIRLMHGACAEAAKLSADRKTRSCVQPLVWWIPKRQFKEASLSCSYVELERQAAVTIGASVEEAPIIENPQLLVNLFKSLLGIL